MLSIMALEKLAEESLDARVRARLTALAAGCQAHASRLLARMAALGGSPLPVPPEDVELSENFAEALKTEAQRARNLAERYSLIAQFARKLNDASAAWVCELNRAEELDRSAELEEMAERLEKAVTQRQHQEEKRATRRTKEQRT